MGGLLQSPAEPEPRVTSQTSGRLRPAQPFLSQPRAPAGTHHRAGPGAPFAFPTCRVDESSCPAPHCDLSAWFGGEWQDRACCDPGAGPVAWASEQPEPCCPRTSASHVPKSYSASSRRSCRSFYLNISFKGHVAPEVRARWLWEEEYPVSPAVHVLTGCPPVATQPLPL